MEGLDELKVFVSHSIRGIWKYRWIGVLAAWAVLCGGILYVDQIEDRYVAKTKVFIDYKSLLTPLLKGLAAESDVNAAIQLMARDLLSRTNIETLIRKADLDLDIEDSQQMDAMIVDVRQRITVKGSKGGDTYRIYVEDTDPERAQTIVQTLLDVFVENSLGETGSETDEAIEFLNSQIVKYDGLLREAEERREEFKRKNIGLMPKDGANYYDQLQESTVKLEQAELLLTESENRREKIRLQIAELKSGDQDVVASVKSSLDGRIENQEEKVDELLLLYTDEHPDVINARVVLKSLNERRLNELELLEQSDLSNSGSTNPVLQELQILLVQTEVDISSYSTRVAAMQRDRAKLQRLVDIVPKIETELKRLNRDYEVHRKNYNELVARREQAKIYEDVESGGDQVRFRVIEPANVPNEPEYPNRPLLDLGVLGAAIAIGYGVSLLISFFQPVFYNVKEIRSVLHTPILGSIRKFDTPQVLRKRRMNLTWFSLANLSLLSLAGFLIHLHHQDESILVLIQEANILGRVQDAEIVQRIQELVI
jgi:polysaccharide chain length determinant protein (PEP-CTERM system associated)